MTISLLFEMLGANYMAKSKKVFNSSAFSHNVLYNSKEDKHINPFQLMKLLAGLENSQTNSVNDPVAQQTNSINDSINDESLNPFELMDKITKMTGGISHGYRQLYSGSSGKKMQGLVFTVNLEFQTFQHMVLDKIQIRGAEGTIDFKTQQATHGRGEGGAVKWGTWDSYIAITHQASSVLVDRTHYSSDPLVVYGCQGCGRIIDNYDMNWVGDNRRCTFCDDTNIGIVRISRASNIIAQSLAHAGIKFTFKFSVKK